MISFSSLFCEYSEEILQGIRRRRNLQIRKSKLQQHQESIANELLLYEEKHDSALRQTRISLNTAQNAYTAAMNLERESWESYRQTLTPITSLLNCISTTIGKLVHKTPGVNSYASRAVNLNIVWMGHWKTMKKAESEFIIAQQHHDEINAPIESNRFAINSLASELSLINDQLIQEEESISNSIVQSIRGMTFNTMERWKAQFPVMDDEFFVCARQLKVALCRLDSCNQITPTKFDSIDVETQASQLKKQIEQAFVEVQLPIECSVEVAGQGLINDRGPQREHEPSGAIQVNFRDHIDCKTNFPQLKWHSALVSDQFTNSIMSIQNQATKSATISELNDHIPRIESEVQILSRRITQFLYSVLMT